MKLSEKDKKLLVLLLLIVVLCVLYFFVYSPLSKKISALREEVQKLETDLSILNDKSVQNDELKAKEKFIRYQLEHLNTLLPPDILQERVIIILNELKNASGVQLKNVSFSEVTTILSDEAQKEQDNSEEQSLLGQIIPSDSEGEKQEETQDAQGIADNTGIKMTVRASYVASYQQIKKFLALVAGYENKISVTDITFAKGEGNNVTGNLSVTFYGFKDSTQKLPEWETSTKTGKDNPFESPAGLEEVETVVPEEEESSEENAESVSLYDFYLILNPVTDDAPAVILGKSKSIGSEIYADGNRFFDVDFHVEERNGRYFYKYSTGSASYPADFNSDLEFSPVDSRGVILKIISKKPVIPQDAAGVNLNIYNNTGNKLIIDMNKEQWNSRVNINVKKGAISVEER